MHAAADGDYGPLIIGVFFALVSLVPLFDIRGFCTYLARRVIARSRLHRRVPERFAYWTLRASGVSGLMVAALFIFAA